MVLLAIIQAVVYLWSILTWPIYFLLYLPWLKTKKYRRQRCDVIDSKEDEILYRAVPRESNVAGQMKSQNFKTMNDSWNYSMTQYNAKRCLGTRRILEEKKVPGPNGKMFTKYIMESTYKWITYNDVDKKSTNFGRYAMHSKKCY